MINYFIHPLREATKKSTFFHYVCEKWKLSLTPTESPFAAFFGLVAVFFQISIHLLYEQTDRIFRQNFSIFRWISAKNPHFFEVHSPRNLLRPPPNFTHVGGFFLVTSLKYRHHIIIFVILRKIALLYFMGRMNNLSSAILSTLLKEHQLTKKHSITIV